MQWIELPREFWIRSNGYLQKDSIETYFEMLTHLAQENPSCPVIKYGLQELGMHFDLLSKQALQTLPKKLIKTMTLQRQGLPMALTMLKNLFSLSIPMNKHDLSVALEEHIMMAAADGEASEVAWALWGAIDFGVPLGNPITCTLARLEDSLVGILTVEGWLRGQFHLNQQELSDLIQKLGRDGLYGRHWIFNYENAAREWPICNERPEKVHLDRFFSYLRDKNVHFYTGAISK
jgi:hypothetical protein